MKIYLIVTATIFALVTILHVWRAVEESATLAKDPWFLIISALAALLCAWACRLLYVSRGASTKGRASD